MPTWLMILLGRAAAGERLRKSTQSDYRTAFGHLALLPIFGMASVFLMTRIPSSVVSGFPFWAIVTVLGILYFFTVLIVAPKIPSPILLLVAIVSWSCGAWLLLSL